MPRRKHTEPFTLLKLKLHKDKGELVIPSVQRELVWTKSQNELLIDSLFRDFDIPKIYFRLIEGDKTQYEVVDGQQRLNAIFDFMNSKSTMPSDADSIHGEEVADKTYNELSTDLQVDFSSKSIDVVVLEGYTDEEMEETFLRLQNGTPLRAPEKRRAISGNMRDVVKDIAEHKVFKNYCDFSNAHYAYEDVAAKILIQIYHGGPTSISAPSLKRMFEQHKDVKSSDKEVRDIETALNFLDRAFKNNSNPKLKKYAIADLAIIASSFLKTYDLNNYADEFGEVYLGFLNERALNAEKPEDQQDGRLNSYTNCARGDSLEFITYRQNYLRDYFLEKMRYLEVKDSRRDFTPEQRMVLYRLGEGKCAICGKELGENEFEADHITPHSKGGKTEISNGQILCVECNRKKSNKVDGDSYTARESDSDQPLSLTPDA